MRNTDISKYNDEATPSAAVSAGSVIKEIFSIFGKLFMTVFLVTMITGIVLLLSLVFYVVDISNEPLNINLSKMKNLLILI